MKREILFKAKTVHGNLWIESHSIIQYDGKVFFAQLLIENDKKTIIEHEIVKETLSQFIGLTDKNGIKIFEGDLIRWGMDNQEAWIRIAKVIFNPDIKFEIMHYIHGKTKEVKESDGKIFKYGNFLYNKTDSYVEIIGNIHDNG